jgi:hypothetical protein
MLHRVLAGVIHLSCLTTGKICRTLHSIVKKFKVLSEDFYSVKSSIIIIIWLVIRVVKIVLKTILIFIFFILEIQMKILLSISIIGLSCFFFLIIIFIVHVCSSESHQPFLSLNLIVEGRLPLGTSSPILIRIAFSIQ